LKTTHLIGENSELLIDKFTRCDRLPYVNPVKQPQSSQVQQDYTSVETTILSTGHTCTYTNITIVITILRTIFRQSYPDMIV